MNNYSKLKGTTEKEFHIGKPGKGLTIKQNNDGETVLSNKLGVERLIGQANIRGTLSQGALNALPTSKAVRDSIYGKIRVVNDMYDGSTDNYDFIYHPTNVKQDRHDNEYGKYTIMYKKENGKMLNLWPLTTASQVRQETDKRLLGETSFVLGGNINVDDNNNTIVTGNRATFNLDMSKIDESIVVDLPHRSGQIALTSDTPNIRITSDILDTRYVNGILSVNPFDIPTGGGFNWGNPAAGSTQLAWSGHFKTNILTSPIINSTAVNSDTYNGIGISQISGKFTLQNGSSSRYENIGNIKMDALASEITLGNKVLKLGTDALPNRVAVFDSSGALTTEEVLSISKGGIGRNVVEKGKVLIGSDSDETREPSWRNLVSSDIPQNLTINSINLTNASEEVPTIAAEGGTLYIGRGVPESVVIRGDLVVQGSHTVTETGSLATRDDIIELRKDSEAPQQGTLAGLIVSQHEMYEDGNMKYASLLFDPRGWAYVGNSKVDVETGQVIDGSELQKITTRGEFTQQDDGRITVWDGNKKQLRLDDKLGKANITLMGTDDLEVSGVGTFNVNDQANRIITMKHSDIIRTDRDGSNIEDYNFSAVTNITTSKTGHITEVTKSPIKVPKPSNNEIRMVAGNGIVTGGSFTLNQPEDQDITFNLGTPSTISSVTQNQVTSESHTHKIEAGNLIANNSNVIGISGMGRLLDSDLEITLKEEYGESINPYGTKARNMILASPNTKDGGLPIFRSLELDDMPTMLDIEEDTLYTAVSVNRQGVVTDGYQMFEIGEEDQTEPSDNLIVGGLFFQRVVV